MRATIIQANTVKGSVAQMNASYKKNRIHYFQEAAGIGIFMASACYFGTLLESKNGVLHLAIPNDLMRMVLMGILMGCTALFIFYSPLTAPSGSHINPAVTMVFFRLGKISRWDAAFYILFQFAGGLLAVYIMGLLLGYPLKSQPVNYVCTVPGKYGPVPAAITEFLTAFIMIMMVLFTSDIDSLKRHTRTIGACLVCLYVIFAGPVSGFGMNPARTFASAFHAHNYSSCWIYMIVPLAGMLSAAEIFHTYKKRKQSGREPRHTGESFSSGSIKTAQNEIIF